jgi:hypothetical protein
MNPISPGDLLTDTARAFRALRTLEKFAVARVLTPNGPFQLQIIPSAGNCYFDLRGLSPTGRNDSPVLPPGPDGWVLFSDNTDPSGYRWVDLGTEFSTWVSRAETAGGTFTTNSKPIAAKLLRGIRESTYNSKIKYLLPFLGSNLATACIPLRDTFAVGAAINTGFVAADFSESTGLQGGAGRLDTQLTPAQIGTSSNGGLGFWATAVGGGSFCDIGMLSGFAGGRAYLLFTSTTLQRFAWGEWDPWAITYTHTLSPGHYYGQRSSNTDRRIFFNGTQQGISTTAGSDTGGMSDFRIEVLGQSSFGGTYSTDRAGAAYMTDGTMTPTEIAAFHTLLQTTLITPLGR